VSAGDPDLQRAEMLERWELAAAGWGKRAVRTRAWGMPVSIWMIEHAELQPGLRVLELAAGPGDTGFLAAELIRSPRGAPRISGSRTSSSSGWSSSGSTCRPQLSM
jgi:hypothetical protein